MDSVADYIIVGAGSAGCVLANRLSADGRNKVLLLEAGGDDRPHRNLFQLYSNVMIHVPVGFTRTLKDPKVNWLYETEPDPGTGNRKHIWPRGKVLGGSSSINGLLYVRGQHADYDLWRQLGCEGWSWSDVLPYFRRSQHQERGASDLHAEGGPLNVSDPRDSHVVSEAVLEAFDQAGIPHKEDLNGENQEGASWYQLTVRNGLRCSAAVAYLHPAMRRPNLRVETKALAARVLFEGKRAIGVEYTKDGRTFRARANAEVILSGGAINSPQLLELSGIGSGAVLQKQGIAVVKELAGVGENLQDHFRLTVQFRLKPHVVSVNELTRGWRFAREIARYATVRRGLLTLSSAHIAAFCKSRPELEHPDIQFHVMPGTMDPKAIYRMQLERKPGLTLSPCQLRPESRGWVHVRSADHRTHPSIFANYLDHQIDRDAAVAGIRIARNVASQKPLQPFIEHELYPGSEAQSDEALLAYARDNGATIYHPVGTCQMGHGAMSVVDPQLRVHGVDGLRVVDASVMPRLVSGNTNAPTIMIAEKASDMILTRMRQAA